MLELNSIDDLNRVLADSAAKPVILFKHSTRCPISFAAFDEYQSFVQSIDENEILCTFLDLIEHRDVSAEIADKTAVVHQSPQAIIIVGGVVQWSATHSAINLTSLQQAVSAL